MPVLEGTGNEIDILLPSVVGIESLIATTESFVAFY